jgi:hypothetical protein
MSPTAPIRQSLSKCEAACLNATMDDGLPEDVLDLPRHLLVRAIKALDNYPLKADPTAVALMGALQGRLGGLLQELNRCLPRANIETSMAKARPVLAEIVAAIPQLLDDVHRLDDLVSPFVDLGL